MAKVLIVVGSQSDMEIAEKAKEVLDAFEINYDLVVASAHRNPEKVVELAKLAENGKYDVIIAIAGLAAHLPGFIASHTRKPVIGVPVNKAFLGLDSLLSIVQMPPKVPVAAVGIDNGKNAAYLAIRILALKYPEIDEKLKKFVEELKNG